MNRDTSAPQVHALPELIVSRIDVVPVSVPFEHPVKTASGDITHAPLALVDVWTEQGIAGRSYVFTYTPVALMPVARVVENLAPALRGTPLAPQAMTRMFDARFRLLGNTGLLAMALAGIDMAVWDALARAAGLPLARLLGGTTSRVPAYFSTGMDGATHGRARAREARARGFRMMKIKIGYSTLAEDVDVITAVQGELGADIALCVDYNQSLTVPEALRRCRALDDLRLAWIEEPTRQDDYEGHARIADAVSTPIQMGENWFGIHEMAKSIAARASDLAMVDVMKIGGVTGWLSAAALAHAARLPVSSHTFHEVSAHLMTVTPTAHWLEFLDLAGPVLARGLAIEDGMAVIGDEAGTGIEWNVAAVEQYRVR